MNTDNPWKVAFLTSSVISIVLILFILASGSDGERYALKDTNNGLFLLDTSEGRTWQYRIIVDDFKNEIASGGRYWNIVPALDTLEDQEAWEAQQWRTHNAIKEAENALKKNKK